MDAIVTARFRLESVTLAMIEAVFRGDRAELERVACAKVPAAWPGRALIERAFSASLDAIRQAPEVRLWGDRLVVAERPVTGLTKDDGDARERLVVGSVIFHGRPAADGVAEIGYGIEESWQRKGVASEVTRAAVEWAFTQPEVTAVTATTPPWHAASIRVLENAGLLRVGAEEHETLGEVLRFTRKRT